MDCNRKINNYFMLHAAQAQLIDAMTDEQAGKLIKALCKEHLQEKQNFDGMDAMTKAIYSVISEQMQREAEAYARKCEINKRNIEKRYEKLREATNVYDGIQTYTNVYDGIQTYTNVDKEKEKEKENEKENEKEKEKEKEIGQETSSCPNSSSNITDSVAKNLFSLSDGFTKRVVELWNTLNLQQIRSIVVGSIRHQNLVARVKEFGEEAVFEAINNVAMSEFLRGNNREGWQATFEWMVKPNNFVKVLEGNYANRVTRVTDTPDRIAIVDTFK